MKKTMICPSAPHGEYTISAPNSLPATQRILVVEDDKGNALVIRTILDLLGYIYDIVETGEEAVEAVQRNIYSVILMDMVLNGISGIETTKRIRAHELGNRLPPAHIIAVSAYASIDAKEACMNAGMNDYLPKPYQWEEVSHRLQQQAFLYDTEQN